MPAVTGGVQAERIPNGQHPLADLQLVRVAQVRHRQTSGARGVDLNHCEVRQRVHPDDFRLELALVREQHLDAHRPIHHMLVGNDIALLRDQDAAPHALPHAPLETPLRLFVEVAKPVARQLARSRKLDLDVHHRRRDAAGHLFEQVV